MYFKPHQIECLEFRGAWPRETAVWPSLQLVEAPATLPLVISGLDHNHCNPICPC